jgi:hypothetical protein
MNSDIFIEHPRRRTQTGGGIIFTALFFSFFIILPLILWYFETSRFNLIEQQLHNVTDAAALSGTAGLASAPQDQGVGGGQTIAMQTAVITFEQNSVQSLAFTSNNTQASLNGSALPAPNTVNTAVLNIVLVDQNGTGVNTGDPSAKTMRVTAMVAMPTIFASYFLPVAPFEVATAISNGGLPQVDIILAFDCSGSMDDQTPIDLMMRRWAGGATSTANAVTYRTVTTGNTIYATFGPPFTGTGFNAMQPQNLTYGAYTGANANTTGYIFSDGVYSASLNGLRTATTTGALIPEQGGAPGNFNPANTPAHVLPNTNDPTLAAYNSYFTDCIVEIGNQTYNSNSYTFTNANLTTQRAICIEASRGNLEDATSFTNSLAKNRLNGIVSPKAGYYAAYWNGVQQEAQPIGQSRTAADQFFATINASANAHFGLVCFADGAGTGANSTWTGTGTTNNNIDANYAAGGTNNFPIPFIALNPGSSTTDTNFTTVTNAINGNYSTGGSTLPLGATGATDISDALQTAYTELLSGDHRPTAKRATVLFTDGVPNRPTSGSAPDYGAFTQASNLGGQGIPCFCIGLSQNATIEPHETQVLGDNNPLDCPDNSLGMQGIAYLAGNNSTFQMVTNTADLQTAFQNVARALVVLQ